MLTLNIIGGGRTGQSLAKLWLDSGAVQIGSVLNRSIESSQTAIQYLGAGCPVSEVSEMSSAELWMLTTSDSAIEPMAEQLASSGLLTEKPIVFHCSGLLSSDSLKSVEEAGASVASIHPLMSFAKPLRDPLGLRGAFCGYEGAVTATNELVSLFKRLGAKCFPIEKEQKALYHAASVLCCNKLTALTEASLQLFETAGLDRHIATQLMQPLMEATLTNIFQQGTVEALTGPIARGDSSSVEQHLLALSHYDANTLNIYKNLGQVACELSAQQGNAKPNQLTQIKRLLE